MSIENGDESGDPGEGGASDRSGPPGGAERVDPPPDIGTSAGTTPDRATYRRILEAGVTAWLGDERCLALLVRQAPDRLDDDPGHPLRLVVVGAAGDWQPGPGGSGAETHPGHRATAEVCVVPDLDEALLVLRPRTGGAPRPGHDETWSLIVVEAPRAFPPAALERLVALARERPGPRVSLLVGGSAALGSASMAIHAREGTETACFTRDPGAGTPSAGAPATSGDRRDRATTRQESTLLEDRLPGLGRDAAPRAPVEVSVLGPIEIRGADEELARHPRLTELVVYLAMHPRGSTSGTWSTALWPDRRVPLQTIANRLSEARRALGFAADHQARLRKVADRHLLVEVATDWERFLRLVAEGTGPAEWHLALELVRGRPFADLHQGQWVALEGFEGEVDSAIVECALRTGEHSLAADDPVTAGWAAHQALRASPWDERLYRLLMRAADAAGNRAGVETAMRTLALVLEIDGDPLQGVHPETAALYARLVGRRAVAAR